MSNRLYNIAQRVLTVTVIGIERPLHPSEKAVLLALANDARDLDGGRSKLTTAQIADRSQLSVRSIRNAYGVLQDAGHITREPGPAGAAFVTRVHPLICPEQPLPGGQAAIAGGTGNHCRGSIESKDSTIDHSPQARAQAVEINQPEAAPPDPVDQVFAAWDAMAARVGLPGPVARDGVRAQAISGRLRSEKLWRVLAAVDAVGRSDFLTGRGRAGRAGQGDFMASFDWVFEVGRHSGSRVFTQLLEGSYNGGQAVPRAPPASIIPATIAAPNIDATEPPRTQALRAALRERSTDRNTATWIDPLRFEWRGDDLVAWAPSAFHADWVTTHFASELRRAAGGAVSIRVSTREKATAWQP